MVRINMLCSRNAELVDRVSVVSGEGGLEFVNELGSGTSWMRGFGNEFRSHGTHTTFILTP